MQYSWVMIKCPACKSIVKPSRLNCSGCGLVIEGDFFLPRLARLSQEHQVLVEAFICSGGNLKDLSSEMGVSYPTMRKKVDALVAALQELKEKDQQLIDEILSDIETGKINAVTGLRAIQEISGEL